jgi:hypothetical protein
MYFPQPYVGDVSRSGMIRQEPGRTGYVETIALPTSLTPTQSDGNGQARLFRPCDGPTLTQPPTRDKFCQPGSSRAYDCRTAVTANVTYLIVKLPPAASIASPTPCSSSPNLPSGTALPVVCSASNHSSRA